MQGPGFFKQRGKERASIDASIKVAVVAQEVAGGVIGTISADSTVTQVLAASADSEIAGSQVEFPPGSLAISTDVALKPGIVLATAAVVAQLDSRAEITSAGAPVELSSSVKMDATQPFTLAIAMPDGAALALADSHQNLAVLYHVNKAAAGGVDFTGLIPRDALVVEGKVVRFAAKYFGTYQSVITSVPITEAKEVQAAPATKLPEPKPIRNVYFVKGAAGTTFGDSQGQSVSGFSGWVNKLKPGKVVNKSSLSSNVLSKKKAGD